MIVEVLWRYLTKTTVRETSIQMEELRNTWGQAHFEMRSKRWAGWFVSGQSSGGRWCYPYSTCKCARVWAADNRYANAKWNSISPLKHLTWSNKKTVISSLR
jgi:hypothetical protein